MYGNVTNVLKFSVSITLIGMLYFILIISNGTVKCVETDLLKKKCIMCICVQTKVLSTDVNIVGNRLLNKMRLKYHM